LHSILVGSRSTPVTRRVSRLVLAATLDEHEDDTIDEHEFVNMVSPLSSLPVA